MNALSAMLAISALPPPPAPTGNPPIDTAHVIGIVLIALGVIALVTLLLRPLVVKRHAGSAHPIAEPPMPDEPAEALAEPPSGRGIIRFPAPFTADAGHGWQVNEPAVAERFQRVVGPRDRRRKLGDRNPGRGAGPDAGGGDRRAREPRHPAPAHSATRPNGTVIPIYDRPTAHTARATGASAWSVAEPREHEERVWTESQPDMRTLERARAGGPRRPLAPARRACHRDAAEPGFPHEAAPAPGEHAIGETAEQRGGTPRGDDRMIADTPVFNEDWFVWEEPARIVGEPAPPARAESDQGLERAHADLAPPDDAAAPEPVVSGDASDPESLRQITRAIRALIFCANTGEVSRGLEFYSEDHLARLMASTGMSEAEFRDAIAAAQPRAPETWERLDTLRDLTRLPDGRIEVTASYVDTRGVPSNGLERYRFVYAPDRQLWLIDDIIQLPVDQ